MDEYIEREAAMDIFGDVPMWNGYYEPYPFEVHCAIVGVVKLIKEELRKVPTADVVPVVRCRDCEHLVNATVNGNGFLICDISDMETAPDDFCSHGDRREEAGS